MPSSSRRARAAATASHSAREPSSPSEPSALQQLGQVQLGLVRAHRVGVAAAVRVDHEQVHGVGADVEHAQSHGADGTRTGLDRSAR